MSSANSLNQPHDALSSALVPRPSSGSLSKPISSLILLFFTASPCFFPGISDLSSGYSSFFAPLLHDLWWDRLPSNRVSMPFAGAVLLSAKGYTFHRRIAVVTLQSMNTLLQQQGRLIMRPPGAKRSLPAGLPRLLMFCILLVAETLQA